MAGETEALFSTFFYCCGIVLIATSIAFFAAMVCRLWPRYHELRPSLAQIVKDFAAPLGGLMLGWIAWDGFLGPTCNNLSRGRRFVDSLLAIGVFALWRLFFRAAASGNLSWMRNVSQDPDQIPSDGSSASRAAGR